MRPVPPTVCLAAAMLLALPAARAQDNAEARLRDALRRTTIELRGLQDSQAALQASADQAKQQRDDLQKQVDALTAKLADAAKSAQSEQEIAQLRAALQSQQDQNKVLQSGLQRWQGAYQQAAEVARAKDAESKTLGTRSKELDGKLGVCTAANGKLIAVADDILHLYRTQDFRSLLLGSYEPLLGLKKVELQNTVQSYEDRILDQTYYADQPVARPQTGH
jgi:predicted  nucleic acid-binding Zn-ribbon protein